MVLLATGVGLNDPLNVGSNVFAFAFDGGGSGGSGVLRLGPPLSFMAIKKRIFEKIKHGKSTKNFFLPSITTYLVSCLFLVFNFVLKKYLRVYLKAGNKIQNF